MFNHLTLEEHGAQLVVGAALGDLDALCQILGGLPDDKAGVRIFGLLPLNEFLASKSTIVSLASQFLGAGCKPVRAILFDKTMGGNWSLAWHQDRVICVKQRIDVEGFGPWGVKRGLLHVVPPFELLARMLTVRIHLDEVSVHNAPLLAALGSHRFGRIPASRVEEVVASCQKLACLASAGDVWLYRTPILHASGVTSAPTRRRVLQIDFSADELPGGLQWTEI